MKMSMNSSIPVTHIFHISEIAGELLQSPTFHFQVQRIAARGIQNEPDCHEKMLGLIFALSSGIFALSNITFFVKLREISKTNRNFQQMHSAAVLKLSG